MRFIQKILIVSFGVFSFPMFSQVGENDHHVSIPIIGFRYGVCSSDAMYYSNKYIPNQFDPTGPSMGVIDHTYADKFNYFGTQFTFEQFAKNGYFMADFSGILDYIVFSPFGHQFRTGKLKNFKTNFPQGDEKTQNLGGIYTDVFGIRAAGGGPIAEYVYIKVGGHYNYGTQQSVADFSEQTGAKLVNYEGYRHVSGFNLNLMVENKDGFIWRNTFLYNFYGNKINGKGYKIESVAYIGGGLSVGFFHQLTNMIGRKAEPWIYGEDQVINPAATFKNTGFTISMIVPNSSN